jgi:anti-sigma28 factor (negative regulator of flagellin synthesis)
MRLEDLGGGTGRAAPVGKSSSQMTGKPTARPASLAGDRVDLSRLSEALAGNSPTPARVETLRVEFANGTYQVDSRQVAQRIIDFYLEGDLWRREA